MADEHKMNIRFPAEWRHKIRTAAAEADQSMNQWIVEAIREKMKKKEKEETQIFPEASLENAALKRLEKAGIDTSNIHSRKDLLVAIQSHIRPDVDLDDFKSIFLDVKKEEQIRGLLRSMP